MNAHYIWVLLIICATWRSGVAAAETKETQSNVLSASKLQEESSRPRNILTNEEQKSRDKDENDLAYQYEEDYDETYARDFPYGQPIAQYRMDEPGSSRQGRAHIRIIQRTANPRTYAKKYRTWAPGKEFLKPRKTRPPLKKYRPPPPHQNRPARPGSRRKNEMPNRRRKFPPAHSNRLRRPKPPREFDYEYTSEEDYFPEESQKHEYSHSKKRPNKSKRPVSKDSEDMPTISYSNFVQHPHGSSHEHRDVVDDDRIREPERRRKKKRRKNDRDREEYKRPRGGDRGDSLEEDLYGATSEENQRYEKFPPYADEEQPIRRPIRHPVIASTTPLYGDGYIGHHSSRVPQNVNLFSDGGLSHYQTESSPVGAQSFQNQPQYQPENYQQNQFNPTMASFGASYNKFNNNLRPNFMLNQNYNPFNNPSLQTNSYAQSNFGANRVQNPFSNSQPQMFPQSYNQNPVQPSTYTNRGNEYSSRYKSTTASFFDNTDNFQDFNRNADYQQSTATNRNSFIPSAEYREPPAVAPSSDDDFINRHLDLYSNGMKGVPVQGASGAGSAIRGPTRTHDFDIGYGEIHYDETHPT